MNIQILAMLGDDIASNGSTLETILSWAKVTEPWELWWVAFGIVAQGIFFCRWIVQWIASEKRGRSHIPELFWWLSLIGAAMLLVYYCLRGEPVGILSQLTGWTIYCRNLYLIRHGRHKKHVLEEADKIHAE